MSGACDFSITECGEFMGFPGEIGREQKIDIDQGAIDFLIWLADRPPKNIDDVLSDRVGRYFHGVASAPIDMYLAILHFAATLGVFGEKQQELARKRNKFVIKTFTTLYHSTTGESSVPIKNMKDLTPDNFKSKVDVYVNDKKVLSGGQFYDEDGSQKRILGYDKTELFIRIAAIYFSEKVDYIYFSGRFTANSIMIAIEAMTFRTLGFANASTFGQILLSIAKGDFNNFLQRVASALTFMAVHFILLTSGAVLRKLINLEKKYGNIENIATFTILDIIDAWLTGGSGEEISKELYDKILKDALVGDRYIFKYTEDHLKIWDEIFKFQQEFFKQK